MVVGNDQIHAQRSRKVSLLHGRDAVIHRYDKGAALVVHGLDGVLGQAVAVPLAAGQHTLDGRAHALEVLVQQGGSGHAVHIVIAKNRDGLAIVNGLPDALTGGIHIREQCRVGKFLLPCQQGQCFGGVGDAPGGKNARQQGVFLLLRRQHGLIFFVRPRRFVHGLLFQLCCCLLRNGGGQLPHSGAVQRFLFPSAVGHSNSLPVRPSLASIPCKAAISEEISIATSESR